MKRLSDKRVAVVLLHLRGVTSVDTLSEEGSLRMDAADGLEQAREDVKRLAGILRACATEAPDGTLCWCGDGEVNAYCWHKPGGRSDFCIRRSAILGEVAP